VAGRDDNHSVRVVEAIELTWVSRDFHVIEGFTAKTRTRQRHKVTLPNNRLRNRV